MNYEKERPRGKLDQNKKKTRSHTAHHAGIKNMLRMYVCRGLELLSEIKYKHFFVSVCILLGFKCIHPLSGVKKKKGVPFYSCFLFCVPSSSYRITRKKNRFRFISSIPFDASFEYWRRHKKRNRVKTLLEFSRCIITPDQPRNKSKNNHHPALVQNKRCCPTIHQHTTWRPLR